MSEHSEMGRPTTYKPEFVQKALDYFNRDKYIIEAREQVTASGRVAVVNEKIPNEFPSIAGLAVSLKCAKSTIYEWAKTHSDFSDALDYGRAIQENWLMDHSLAGRWNAGMAKFLMINNHAYKDKVEQEVNQTSEIVFRDQDSEL